MNSEFRKSSYSSQSGGNCVEAGTDAQGVLVRDTADRQGAMLVISPAAWARFTTSLR